MAANLSQNELADTILSEFDYNLSRKTYSAYEEGRNEPNIQTLAILSKFYGCSIDDLVLDQMNVDHGLVPETLAIKLELATLEKEYQESQYKKVRDQYRTLQQYYEALLELYSCQNKEILVESPRARGSQILFVSLEHSFSDNEIYLITREINFIGAVIKFLSGIIIG